MLTLFKHCEIHCTSNLTEIISILERNSVALQPSVGILIGSRAARWYLPNFRDTSENKDSDWDVIIPSDTLLKWLRSLEKNINSIEMIIPAIDDLDLYVNCIISEKSKYDFVIPRSSTSYTAYLLNNERYWIDDRTNWIAYAKDTKFFQKGSPKLLLMLKKYMLYYPHHWEKTARDYWELLSIVDPLDNDYENTRFRDLFIIYNEKFYGKRSDNEDTFVFTASNAQKQVNINRNEFFQFKELDQVSFIYHAVMSYAGDIFVGLEYVCTQGPLWLADYVIENWIAIQSEKFNKKFRLPDPCIKFEIDNYRLFPTIPEIPTQRILTYLTDAADFHSMQFVCKQWYTIMREELFWRDLYLSRYKKYPNNIDEIKSWKMLYLVRLQTNIVDDKKLGQLVNGMIQLRQFSVNDILKLWEDLTHQEQSVDFILQSKIHYVLSNSFYCDMEQNSDRFTVKLILVGLEDARSWSIVDLKLRFGNYGRESRFMDHMEELSIEYSSNSNDKQSLSFLGPELVGFSFQSRGYVRKQNTLLAKSPSTFCSQFPSGLLICLFIIMVHHDRRAQFIKYLKHLAQHCLINRGIYDYHD